MDHLITGDVLNHWMEDMQKYATKGNVADYIPALSRQNPKNLAVAIHQLNGNRTSAGNTEHLFTLQSISKVISLALALMDNGEERLFSRVGMEPSGNPYNSIAKLINTDHTKPFNPMINAGALVVTNMIHGKTPNEKVERLVSFIRDLTGDTSISYNSEVAASEFKTANLNRSLCYFMKQDEVIKGSVEELLHIYTRQCAVEITITQLARMGALFANEGVDLCSGRQVIPKHVARICKTFMVTCGMYDDSGSFAIKVGIPAKSGVSGAIMGAAKGFGGIGVFGPALDAKGNSVVGLKLLELIAHRYELSIF